MLCLAHIVRYVSKDVVVRNYHVRDYSPSVPEIRRFALYVSHV